jgi:hypothetical protein
MTTPQQNTKVEALVEAIENFSINIAQGIVAAANHRINGQHARDLHDLRQGARAEMASALREFLQPSLRIITEREERVGDLSTISRKTIERTDAIATKTLTIPQ